MSGTGAKSDKKTCHCHCYLLMLKGQYHMSLLECSEAKSLLVSGVSRGGYRRGTGGYPHCKDPIPKLYRIKPVFLINNFAKTKLFEIIQNFSVWKSGTRIKPADNRSGSERICSGEVCCQHTSQRKRCD